MYVHMRVHIHIVHMHIHIVHIHKCTCMYECTSVSVKQTDSQTDSQTDRQTDRQTLTVTLNMSLCAEPLILVPEKPEPISNPFVAGMDIIA